MAKRIADELVVPRSGAITRRFAGRFKVTARYSVEVAEGKSISCVRVRVGCGPTLHFTRERFDELFRVDREAQRASERREPV